MSDHLEAALRRHLRAVDQAALDDPSMLVDRARSALGLRERNRRIAGGAIAALLVAVAVVALTSLPRRSPTDPASGVTTTSPAVAAATTTAVRPLAGDGGTWRAVPPDPRGVTISAASVWTGSEAITLGGVDQSGDDRAGVVAYDPVTSQWRVLSSEPLPLMWPVAVWTGGRVLIIGWHPGRLNTAAALFDPQTGEWSVGSSTPIGIKVAPRMPWVWTGSELLIAGGDAALGFNVELGSWRVLAHSPLVSRQDAASVWTGTEWITWGGEAMDGSGALGDGAAYDPLADTWRPLPESPLFERLVRGVWTGKEMVITGGRSSNDDGMSADADGAAYDPVANTWRPVAEGPAHPGFVPLWSGRRLYLFAKGGVTAYDPALDRWILDFSGGQAQFDSETTPLWTGREIVLMGSYDARMGGAVFTPDE